MCTCRLSFVVFVCAFTVYLSHVTVRAMGKKTRVLVGWEETTHFVRLTYKISLLLPARDDAHVRRINRRHFHNGV